jgi:hypothetical protein
MVKFIIVIFISCHELMGRMNDYSIIDLCCLTRGEKLYPYVDLECFKNHFMQMLIHIVLNMQDYPHPILLLKFVDLPLALLAIKKGNEQGAVVAERSSELIS